MTTFCKKLYNEGMVELLQSYFEDCESSIVSGTTVIKDEGLKAFNSSKNDLLQVIAEEDFKLLRKLLKRKEWRNVIDGKEFIKYGGVFRTHKEAGAARSGTAITRRQ